MHLSRKTLKTGGGQSFNRVVSKLWSEIHVSFDKKELPKNSSESTALEHEWRKRMINETPNGKLLVQNSFLENLKDSRNVHLAHITPNLKEILRSKKLYASGGCLIGGVYVSPLFSENGRFRMHNLGRYIFEKEAPRASHLQKRNNPSVLIIETSIPQKNGRLIGIDYTRLGKIHLETYRELATKLSPEEKRILNRKVFKKIRKLSKLLTLVNSSFADNKPVKPKLFLRLYTNTVRHLPTLGYLYFEAVSEYIILHQDSAEARRSHAVGELCNWGYKNMMFDLFPGLLRGKKLDVFKPTLEQLNEYIERKGIISKFNKNHFSRHLTERLNLLIYTRLLNGVQSPIDLSAQYPNLDGLAIKFPQLVGNIIYHEFSALGKRFEFDQFEATQIWEYWNSEKIAIPFNGFIPKGESAINPALLGLKYRIYSGETIKSKNDLYLTKGRRLNIKMISRLVNSAYNTMRI